MTPRPNIRRHPLDDYERALRDEPERDGPLNSWALLAAFLLRGLFWFSLAALAIMCFWEG